MAQVEEGFRKTVMTKEDGRYLIFYDFSGADRKTDGRRRRQEEESKQKNLAERK
ncbi:MAG TPA: hypothetical protein VIL66_08205 [Bacillota bacterium]